MTEQQQGAIEALRALRRRRKDVKGISPGEIDRRLDALVEAFPGGPKEQPREECDWGGCEAWAISWRWDDEHGWLPVCSRCALLGYQTTSKTREPMTNSENERLREGRTMTPRDQFAKAAMQAVFLLAHKEGVRHKTVAHDAYDMADAMMEEGQRREKLRVEKEEEAREHLDFDDGDCPV